YLFVWQGLTRLREVNALDARHYSRAVLATDPRQVPPLLLEMTGHPGRQELLDQLALLLKEPTRQAQVARLLHSRFVPYPLTQQRLVELEQLQRVVKDYWEQNFADLKTRPDALVELEKFIAWRPQP